MALISHSILKIRLSPISHTGHGRICRWHHLMLLQNAQTRRGRLQFGPMLHVTGLLDVPMMIYGQSRHVGRAWITGGSRGRQRRSLVLVGRAKALVPTDSRMGRRQLLNLLIRSGLIGQRQSDQGQWIRTFPGLERTASIHIGAESIAVPPTILTLGGSNPSRFRADTRSSSGWSRRGRFMKQLPVNARSTWHRRFLGGGPVWASRMMGFVGRGTWFFGGGYPVFGHLGNPRFDFDFGSLGETGFGWAILGTGRVHVLILDLEQFRLGDLGFDIVILSALVQFHLESANFGLVVLDDLFQALLFLEHVSLQKRDFLGQKWEFGLSLALDLEQKGTHLALEGCLPRVPLRIGWLTRSIWTSFSCSLAAKAANSWRDRSFCSRRRVRMALFWVRLSKRRWWRVSLSFMTASKQWEGHLLDRLSPQLVNLTTNSWTAEAPRLKKKQRIKVMYMFYA